MVQSSHLSVYNQHGQSSHPPPSGRRSFFLHAAARSTAAVLAELSDWGNGAKNAAQE